MIFHEVTQILENISIVQNIEYTFSENVTFPVANKVPC